MQEPITTDLKKVLQLEVVELLDALADFLLFFYFFLPLSLFSFFFFRLERKTDRERG